MKKIELAIDPILNKKLNKEGIQAKVFDSVLSREEKNKMLEDLHFFAGTWFIDGYDRTVYRSISVGAATYDDFMSFYALFLHFGRINELYNDHKIVLYISVSCNLNDKVLDFLKKMNWTVILRKEHYPYLCYSKMFKDIAQGKASSTGLIYRRYCHPNLKQDLKVLLSYFTYKIISLVLIKIFKSGKSDIFIYPIRRMGPILQEEENQGNSIHMPNLSCFKNEGREFDRRSKLSKLLFLARNNKFVSSPYSAKMIKRVCKENLKIDWEKVKEKISKNLSVRDRLGQQGLLDELKGFVYDHYGMCHSLINSIYNSDSFYNFKKVYVEQVSPFYLQYLSLKKREVYFAHLNYFANNQYFLQTDKINYSNMKVLVSSLQEEKRVLNQGFQKDNIIRYNEINIEKIKPNAGEYVLVNPPFLGALCTFRLLLDSTALMGFFEDSIKELARKNKVLFRPHPGVGEINDTGFTLDDFYISQLKEINFFNGSNIYRFGKDAVSLEDDLVSSVYGVGVYSALALDLIKYNKAYFVSDVYELPFFDKENYSVFSTSSPMISIQENKDFYDIEVDDYVDQLKKFCGFFDSNFPSLFNSLN